MLPGSLDKMVHELPGTRNQGFKLTEGLSNTISHTINSLLYLFILNFERVLLSMFQVLSFPAFWRGEAVSLGEGHIWGPQASFVQHQHDRENIWKTGQY